MIDRSLRFANIDCSARTTRKIGDFCSVQMCKRIFKEETSTVGDIPFYKIGTIGSEPDAYISRTLFDEYKSKYNYPRKGEFLISCAGTVGKCVMYNGEDSYYQDSNIVWLRNDSSDVLNEYLFMIVSNVDWGKLNSTTITRIYNDNLRELEFDFPSLVLQRKIASFLLLIDKRIAQEDNLLEKIQMYKQSIMQRLFI